MVQWCSTRRSRRRNIRQLGSRKFLAWLNDHSIIPVTAFFIILIAVGLANFKDYGISWDEPFQKKYGQHLYNFVTEGDTRMLEGPMKYYGPAFEIGLFFAQKALRLEDSRNIYLMRHLLTFLVFFVGAVFFYRLCRRMFRSWKIGLLGALLLVLTPRIFAESFYNPKDVPFMAVFVISVYTLVRYLDAKTIRWAVAHAVACALLVDIRIVGLLVPLFTLGFLGVDAAKVRRDAHLVREHLLSLVVFAAVLAGVVVLAWPTLWHRPIHHLVQAFREMSHYPLEVQVMYRGAYTQARDLPWHYTLVWIAMTTPLIYTAGFLAGCFALLGRPLAAAGKRRAGATVRQLAGNPISDRDSAILLLWFFFPLLYVTISRATLFDGWRHTYFTYPAFLGIVIVGFTWAFRMLRTGLRPRVSRIVTAVVIAAVAIGFANVARIMVKYHPYEHLYFNALTGGIRGAEGKFDMDYWGLSYRQALEQIVKIDKGPAVKVCAYARPGKVNAEILPVEDRQRLVFETDPYDAKYYMTDLRWDKFQYPRDQIVHEIYVDGARIMVVVRVVR